MLSPLRLGLNIPQSPIEKQAFRSRSFRRIIFIACALSLFLATIHSINVNNELRRKFALDYLDFRRDSNLSGLLLRSRPVDKLQFLFDAPGDKSDDRPNAIDDLMEQLPDIIHIPFEEAVNDVELEGWEDDWFSSATYDYERELAEPKLDFVYNCECTTKTENPCVVANSYRVQRFGRRIQEHQT